MPTTPIGQHQFLVTLSLDDLVVTETWDEHSEPESTVPLEDHYNGGSNEAIPWEAGRRTKADFTLRRAWSSTRDMPLLKTLDAKLGATCTASIQPLDRDSAPDGDPLIITGNVKTVKGPAGNAAQAGTKAMFELVIKPSTWS